MIKYFCDKCKKEIGFYVPRHKLIIKNDSNSDFAKTKYIICEYCISKIKDFIIKK